MYTASWSLAILAVARLAMAANPYCLLTAVNKFEQPADQKTLCCKESKKVESYLKELCPAKLLSEAKDAFEKACDEGGYSDCSKDDSSSSSTKKSSSTSAPYPVVHTTTYYDEECGCTKTHTTSVTSAAGSTGFATATNPIATGTAAPGGGAGAGAGAGSGPGAGATGSPIAPATPESTNTPSSFKGAATKNVGSVAAGLIAVAGIAIVL